MLLNTIILSRLQFAFTISFHILFPAFSIGLAIFLSFMEGIWLKTQKAIYRDICQFWTKVFALTFGMGVVSGIVMEFQLGTNWSQFTQSIGGVLGALFTYEVMTAFFIEAGFLGVMLFGWERVGPKLHYLATLLVTIGTTLSAYWIMAANTWMQHPVGYVSQQGAYIASNWWQIALNAAIYPRFVHMLLASYICAGFVVISVSAFYLLRKEHTDFAKTCFKYSWIALSLIVPLQIFFGDLTGIEVKENQPIKTAAMEGLWETQKGAPFLILAYPDQTLQRNVWEIGIPHGAALINTHQWNGELQGLKTVQPADQPHVLWVFYSFRIMVGIGGLMLLLVITSWLLGYRRKLYDSRWFLRIAVASAPLGFIALWFGWITAEVGRQPWAVYHLIRTADAASIVPLHDVVTSFILIILVYGVVFGYCYIYFLNRMLRKGPAYSGKISDQPFQYMSASITQEHKP
ncbi:MAG: cytochrome ubiquinol oxidase subunit I [Gammaproteobacteria bacterium]